MTPKIEGPAIIWHTEALRDAIARKYPSGGYGTFFEVRNAAGFSATRSLDALVVSLWPSRGLTITGIEIKAPRSDWVRERDNPAKADAMFQYCDYWFLVVANKEIVKEGELPTGWGLMAPRGKDLTVVTAADRNTAVKPLDRHLLACIAKRAQESMASAREIQNATTVARKQARAEIEGENKRLERRYDELAEKVRTFEQFAGIDITYLYPPAEQIGAAVRRVLAEDRESVRTKLDRERQALGAVLKSLDAAIATLPPLIPTDL